MVKIYIRRILSIVSIILITHIVLITTQVRYDHNNVGLEGYYMEEKDSLDFVLFGASEAYSDYCPAQAYKDYGFTSYIYAIDNNPFVTYEEQLDEIYRYQNPKLVMVEIATVIPDKEDIGVGEDYFDATFRKLSDSIPDLKTRYDLVKKYGIKDPVESYMYPPIKYHGRAIDVNNIFTMVSLQLRNYSYFKGYVSHTISKDYDKAKMIDTKRFPNNVEPLPEEYEEALRSLLKHCKEKNYNVVFARFPHRIVGKYRLYRYWQGNYAANIIKEAGYDFIDFERLCDKMDIDKGYDFYNESHLRASGAVKMTDFMGKVLTKKYGITPSEQSKENKEKWEECVKYSDAFFKYFDEIKDGKTEEDDVFMTENAFLLSELKKRM